MRLLLTGGGGALARELGDAARAAGHLVDAPARSALDVTDAAAVRRALRELRPDVVVNAAAMTDVDACEHDAERATRVNVDGPRAVARACAEAGARLVHVSTDLVFGGATPRGVAGAPLGWRPDDPPAPVQVYGRTKLAGELAVADELEDHVVVRVSVLAGRYAHGFVGKVAARARAGQPLRVVDDQVASPTATCDLVPALLDLLVDGRTGVVHRAGGGHASRHALALAVVEELGLDVHVEPISSSDLPPGGAPRPGWSVLEDPDGTLPHWRQGLAHLAAQLGDALGARAAP